MNVQANETLTFGCSTGAEERRAALLFKELTTISAQIAGYKVKFVEYPWARVVESIKSGQIDGSYCVSYELERESWLDFLTDPFFITKLFFYKASDNPIKASNVQELLQYSIGVHAQSFIANKLINMGAKRLHTVHTSHSLCLLVLLKRVELMPSFAPSYDGIRCGSTIKDLPSERYFLVPIGPSIGQESHHLGISKANPQHKKIKQDFERAFRKLQKEGRLPAIYQRYQVAMPTFEHKP